MDPTGATEQIGRRWSLFP